MILSVILGDLSGQDVSDGPTKNQSTVDLRHPAVSSSNSEAPRATEICGAVAPRTYVLGIKIISLRFSYIIYHAIILKMSP